MNIIDAAHATVEENGGSRVVASRLIQRDGKPMSDAILRNKVNGNNDTHHLTLVEADRLMAVTNDHRILHALAEKHGHVCVMVDDSVPASDLAVLELVTHVWRANGDVGRAVDDTLADGRVEAHEVVMVRHAIYKVQQAMNAMLIRLEGMAE